MRKITISLISFITIIISSCSSQPNWVLLHPTTSPPPLGQSGFAYNTNTNEGIVFGGIYKDKWSDDTWIWDGNNWSISNVTNKPPARTNLAMAYDEARDKMVIFGGSMDKTVFDDTWEWDGNAWKLINPAHTPPARCCHAMAYDSVQKKVLLYGGWNGNTGEFFSDTWAWDGEDWTELPQGNEPLASAHTLVKFSSGNKIISTPSGFNNTWEWDGKVWNQINNASLTPHRADGRSVYDNKYERIILFGGINSGTVFLNDTWVFDGQNWTLLDILSSPPARYSSILFYDVKRNSVILFGGVGADGVLGDTWELTLPKDLSSSIVPITPTP